VPYQGGRPILRRVLF